MRSLKDNISELYDDIICDDDIRVIGAQKKKSARELTPSSKNSFWGKTFIWWALLAAFVSIGLYFLLRPVRPEEDPFDGVYEPKGDIKARPEEEGIRILGNEPDSLLSYTERIDTVINDVSIAIYLPHNAIPELIVGIPTENDLSIILAAQAADIRADNEKILGAFVEKGTPLAWGLSKKGFCAIIDGEMTVGSSDNSPLFEKATDTEGYFFRQFPLVDNGVLVENEQKNKSIRKALCSRLGQFFIAVSGDDESYHDFAQALVDLNVENAISLVGSKSAFGWWIDQDGNLNQFAEGIHKFQMENYVVWKTINPAK